MLQRTSAMWFVQLLQGRKESMRRCWTTSKHRRGIREMARDGRRTRRWRPWVHHLPASYQVKQMSRNTHWLSTERSNRLWMNASRPLEGWAGPDPGAAIGGPGGRRWTERRHCGSPDDRARSIQGTVLGELERRRWVPRQGRGR
jgi:hypothetical protein